MTCLISLAAALIAFSVWHFIGCIVVVIIDKDGEIKLWANKAPFALDMFVPSAWPIILWFYLKKQKSK